MARYKKSIIEKVLFHDLQSGSNNIAKPVTKPRNDKNGKERNAGGVVKKNRG
jgi:hypothetical protein